MVRYWYSIRKKLHTIKAISFLLFHIVFLVYPKDKMSSHFGITSSVLVHHRFTLPAVGRSGLHPSLSFSEELLNLASLLIELACWTLIALCKCFRGTQVCFLPQYKILFVPHCIFWRFRIQTICFVPESADSMESRQIYYETLIWQNNLWKLILKLTANAPELCS